MGRNIEIDYSHIFSIVNQLKGGQNQLTALPKEKLENLLTEGEETAAYYTYWETAKFGWLGSKDKEKFRQGYLEKVKEFRRLKEVYTGIVQKEDSTSQQTGEQSDLGGKLNPKQTQQKDPWVLSIVYQGQTTESRTPVQDRGTLIKLFQSMVKSPLVMDIGMLYFDRNDSQYHKTKNPDELPK